MKMPAVKVLTELRLAVSNEMTTKPKYLGEIKNTVLVI